MLLDVFPTAERSFSPVCFVVVSPFGLFFGVFVFVSVPLMTEPRENLQGDRAEMKCNEDAAACYEPIQEIKSEIEKQNAC